MANLFQPFGLNIQAVFLFNFGFMLQVKSALYLDGYRLRVSFSDGKENIVDFSDFILHADKKHLTKYQKQSHFKKFKIENGNIVWGRDWDLIFPVEQLYEGEIHA